MKYLSLAVLTAGCGFSMRTVGQHDAIVDTVRAVSSDNRAAIEAQSKAQAEMVRALAEALVSASGRSDNGAGAIQAMASAFASARASEGLRAAIPQSCPLPVTVNVPPIVVRHIDSPPKDCSQNFTLSCAERAVAK